MTQVQKHAHFIGIGGIGISALARYYQHLGYSISGSDASDSELARKLEWEGMDFFVGHNESNLPDNTSVVVYSAAIITKPSLTQEENLVANPELAKARGMDVKLLSYPQALAEIANAKKCIAITGSHGKSTTTAMTGIMLMGSSAWGSTIVGTQVPQFGNSNLHAEESEYFAIEACEYKRSFLDYLPYITVITNIDLDHLDYYRDLDDYMSAFQSIVNQTSGYVVFDGDDVNALRLDFSHTKALPIRVTRESTALPSGVLHFPKMELQVPGDHLLFDAKLAFAVGKLLWLEDEYIVHKLESYAGSWRRSEIIGTTANGNMLMSDYGHHPTEIRLTLGAIRDKYPDKKLMVAFQPHQHSRTRELLEDFATSFDAADELIIPNIYFSRDSDADVAYMTTERFVDKLQGKYPFVRNGNGLASTAVALRRFDDGKHWNAIIVLLWAGDIDTLRTKVL